MKVDESKGEWRCRCTPSADFDKSVNPSYVSRCVACRTNRPCKQEEALPSKSKYDRMTKEQLRKRLERADALIVVGGSCVRRGFDKGLGTTIKPDAREVYDRMTDYIREKHEDPMKELNDDNG